MIVEENIKFLGWNCTALSAGNLRAMLAPDIGGRIISLQFEGAELFFTNEKHRGETFEFTDDYHAEKRKLGFRLWGGDKTWVAPQHSWHEHIPPLDLDAAKYRLEINSNSVVMTSPTCRETGLTVIREVSSDRADSLNLNVTFRNDSSLTIQYGIWDVTQMQRPFDIVLPVPCESIKPYEDEGESVGFKKTAVHESEGFSVIQCREARHFKYGAVVPGSAFAVRKTPSGTIVHARKFEKSAGPFAHGANLEVYNSPEMDYMEFEVHSPLLTLKPGEKASHAQKWCFYSVDNGLSLTDINALSGRD